MNRKEHSAIEASENTSVNDCTSENLTNADKTCCLRADEEQKLPDYFLIEFATKLNRLSLNELL